MGEREYEFSDEEHIFTILDDISAISPDFWEDGERHILASAEAPEYLKGDFTAILEVTNQVYENRIPLAAQRYGELSEEQKNLLTTLIIAATTQCDCPHCTSLRIEEADDEEAREQRKSAREAAAHYRALKEVSRQKTYEVSEDLYEMLLNSKISLENISGRLEATIQFLDEEDPRYKFASTLLDIIYY